MKARAEGGPFRGLDDFFERLSTSVVGQGCVETLIKAGAFDCLEGAGERSSWPCCRAPSRRGSRGRPT